MVAIEGLRLEIYVLFIRYSILFALLRLKGRERNVCYCSNQVVICVFIFIVGRTQSEIEEATDPSKEKPAIPSKQLSPSSAVRIRSENIQKEPDFLPPKPKTTYPSSSNTTPQPPRTAVQSQSSATTIPSPTSSYSSRTGGKPPTLLQKITIPFDYPSPYTHSSPLNSPIPFLRQFPPLPSGLTTLAPAPISFHPELFPRENDTAHALNSPTSLVQTSVDAGS